MQRVLAAALAVLVQLQALRIIPTVFHRGVIPLLALGASEVNHHPNVFLLRHDSLTLLDVMSRMGATSRASGPSLSLFQDFGDDTGADGQRSEEHTSELQSRENLVCRLL